MCATPKFRAYSTSAAIVMASARSPGFLRNNNCCPIGGRSPVRNRCNRMVQVSASVGYACLKMCFSAVEKSSTLSDWLCSRVTKVLDATRGSFICPLAFSRATFSFTRTVLVSASKSTYLSTSFPRNNVGRTVSSFAPFHSLAFTTSSNLVQAHLKFSAVISGNGMSKG